ncbi:MAG: hypothetical protein EON54_18260 [Alcaligenaceae bacterium]|nr:MAG: hypothetical protein EON54_18260 [Alcaligenaceae bacterium]
MLTRDGLAEPLVKTRSSRRLFPCAAWFQAEIGAWYRRRDPGFGPDYWLVAEYFEVIRSLV